jgi:hypothetical protein
VDSIRLFQITVAEDQRHDIAELYTKWSIGQMNSRFPNFDWLIFFNTIFEGILDKDNKEIRFNESTEVVIYGVDFVKRLDRLLPEFEPRFGVFIMLLTTPVTLLE